MQSLLLRQQTLHANMAIDVLDSGKHVFVEKPLATSLNDARLVINKWHSVKLKAIIGCNFNLDDHVFIRYYL